MKKIKKDTNHRNIIPAGGFVKNIGREGETYQILPLEILRETAVDMFTTVYIGTEKTMELNGKMVTPRGYREMKKEKA